MAQVFTPKANDLARTMLLVAAVGLALLLSAAFAWVRSPYSSGQGHTPTQPVPFSHQHHVGGLGIDCRYCHGGVEHSAQAGIPPTETCMTCHSQLWTQADMLKAVRDSFRRREPIRWIRVHDLPDFVYFDHSIHVHKGVGCATCHGRVDRMPLMQQASTLFMSWCLECHRSPERFIRPKNRVFEMDWQPDSDHVSATRDLVKDYQIRTGQLTDCYTCHR